MELVPKDEGSAAWPPAPLPPEGAQPFAPGEAAATLHPLRKIIHVDMDAFYASVEQRDAPELRGRPVAVGGSSARSVVAAASYEARRFGVRSAMPSVTALRRCPELVFIRPRFEVYKAISIQILNIFAEYAELIEPLSLDEAALDVTNDKQGIASATRIAARIRAAIREETGLTASAGVSYNKFLAKLASDQRKPDGLFVITPAMGPGFVEALPVGRFHGIGPATEAKMKALGVHTGADLKAMSFDLLARRFGKAAMHYYDIARGIDHRPVRPDRVRRSIGAETTFEENLSRPEEMKEALRPLAAKVWRSCERLGIRGRTVTLKVKFSDFRLITRSRSFFAPVAGESELETAAISLLGHIRPEAREVRLLGVTLSSLVEGARAEEIGQLDLPL